MVRRILIDPIDRQIISLLFRARRPLPGSQIAKRIGFSSAGIKPRLIRLRRKGIIKVIRTGKLRIFKRVFKRKGKRNIIKSIRAPSKLLWVLNIRRR